MESLNISFDTESLWVMNLALALVMYGVALEIETKDFKELLRAPIPILTGLFSQFVALPFVTYLLVTLLQPSAAVAMGLFLVAACPGGNVSNFISHLAKANTALSVSLTAFATLLSIVFTPLNFSWYASLYPPSNEILQQIAIDGWQLTKVVLLLLALPLALGLLTRRYMAGPAILLSKVLKPLSLVIFLGLVVAALSANWRVFAAVAPSYASLVIGHNLLALFTGFSTALLFRMSSVNRKSITIETGIQNSGLGLLLIFTFFDGLTEMAIIAALWGIWHLISGLILGILWGHFPGLFRRCIRAVVRWFLRRSLYSYFNTIELIGLNNIPLKGPVIFVGNHQNALLDALLIASFNRRSTTFFARADVFKYRLISAVLHYLGLLPIYRFRDGAKHLRSNISLFEKGARLLIAGEEALALFPEGNHGAERRVRPLKKGILRLLETVYKLEPNCRPLIVPVGFSYKALDVFDDSVAVRFGHPLDTSRYWDGQTGALDESLLVAIFDSLKKLTIHIEGEDYKGIVANLEQRGVNWLNVDQVYKMLESNNYSSESVRHYPSRKFQLFSLKSLLSYPWRIVILPRIKEREFISTMRFAYLLVVSLFIAIILILGVLIVIGL